MNIHIDESLRFDFTYFNLKNGLGRGSNNQNGNLRWYLPGRGGGSRVPHTYSEKGFF